MRSRSGRLDRKCRLWAVLALGFRGDVRLPDRQSNTKAISAPRVRKSSQPWGVVVPPGGTPRKTLRATYGGNDVADSTMLLKPEAAARALQISRAKLYALLRRGDLRSIKIDGCTRIPVSVLEAFIAERMEDSDNGRAR